MVSLFQTHLKLARTAIKENRTRSFLTCLGIAIGVASIILILSLMGSISNLVKSEISEIGSDLIVVRPSSTKDSITSVIEELTASNSFQKSLIKRNIKRTNFRFPTNSQSSLSFISNIIITTI